jgi:adenosylhomocysteine nucleosidase
MSRIAIIAALPREVASLVAGKHWRREAGTSPDVFVWTHEKAVVALAGMGEPRASLAVNAALATGPVEELVSVGWVGACAPGMPVGTIARPSTVISASTGERFTCREGDGSVLATVTTFAGTEEKRRLHATYGASTVEMEAAAVARLALAHRLSFRAIKAVSDASNFEIPGIERFYTSEGQFREAAFGAYVALRPKLWRPVVTMAKGSKFAAEQLCRELELLALSY